MYATLHQIDGIPGPQDTSWVDEVLTALRTGAYPGRRARRPAARTRPGSSSRSGTTPRDAAAAPTASAPAGGVTVGPEPVRTRSTSAGPGSQCTAGSLPAADRLRRSAQSRVVGGVRPGRRRADPAGRPRPAWAGRGARRRGADGARFSATLAESVEALEAAGAAIMSTELLPGEDPADLTGPDSFAILRLLHADLPVGANR